MTELIWSFAPWIVFLLASRATSFPVAVAAGAVAALVVFGRAIRRRHVHLLDTVSLMYFVALGAVLVVAQPGHLDDWSRYAQAGSHAVLTLVVFGSILVGRPFTESYARETTPTEYWQSDRFRAVNRRISNAWGLAFLVGTASLVLAGSVDVRQVLLRIVVPFGALVLAYKYTQTQIAAQDHTAALEERPSVRP